MEPRPDLAQTVKLVTQAGGNLRGRLPKVARRVNRGAGEHRERLPLGSSEGGARWNLVNQTPAKVARGVRRQGQGANQTFSTRITVSDMGRDEEVTVGEGRGLLRD
jgi:hypothetical protein